MIVRVRSSLIQRRITSLTWSSRNEYPITKSLRDRASSRSNSPSRPRNGPLAWSFARLPNTSAGGSASAGSSVITILSRGNSDWRLSFFHAQSIDPWSLRSRTPRSGRGQSPFSYHLFDARAASDLRRFASDLNRPVVVEGGDSQPSWPSPVSNEREQVLDLLLRRLDLLAKFSDHHGSETFVGDPRPNLSGLISDQPLDQTLRSAGGERALEAARATPYVLATSPRSGPGRRGCSRSQSSSSGSRSAQRTSLPPACSRRSRSGRRRCSSTRSTPSSGPSPNRPRRCAEC